MITNKEILYSSCTIIAGLLILYTLNFSVANNTTQMEELEKYWVILDKELQYFQDIDIVDGSLNDQILKRTSADFLYTDHKLNTLYDESIAFNIDKNEPTKPFIWLNAAFLSFLLTILSIIIHNIISNLKNIPHITNKIYLITQILFAFSFVMMIIMVMTFLFIDCTRCQPDLY